MNEKINYRCRDIDTKGLSHLWQVYKVSDGIHGINIYMYKTISYLTKKDDTITNHHEISKR